MQAFHGRDDPVDLLTGLVYPDIGCMRYSHVASWRANSAVGCVSLPTADTSIAAALPDHVTGVWRRPVEEVHQVGREVVVGVGLVDQP